jgi:glycosyltransferase involved in cell wall biosynthesis
LDSRDQEGQVRDVTSRNALANGHNTEGGPAAGDSTPLAAGIGSGGVSEFVAPHLGTRGLAEWLPRSHPVSVVIPARNEEKCLPYVLNRIPAWVHEVILVDGASADATIDVARHHWPTVRIVRQTGKGKGAALREGFSHSTGDLIVAIDADGSMDPAEMSLYVAVLSLGFDYVKGSPMLPEGGSCDLTPFRRLGNWVFRTLTNLIHRSRFTDLCYGYFAFRRGTVDSLPLRSDDFAIETEINIKAWNAGLKIMEVPSREFDRIDGRSGLRPFADGWRILRAIVRERFAGRAELRSSGNLGLLQPSPVLIDRNESAE